jgi:hypothetical protein
MRSAHAAVPIRMIAPSTATPRKAHTVHSRHDPRQQSITVTHVLGHGGPDATGRVYEVTLPYPLVDQLDKLAVSVGLMPAFRRRDWIGAPFDRGSRDSINGYCFGNDANRATG